MDNCSSQNKNWAFIYIVNSAEVNLKTLSVKYFKPSYTFMSADGFHHELELSLKRKEKVYDFKKYVCAVKNSSKHVQIIEMTTQNFFAWTDHI